MMLMQAVHRCFGGGFIVHQKTQTDTQRSGYLGWRLGRHKASSGRGACGLSIAGLLRLFTDPPPCPATCAEIPGSAPTIPTTSATSCTGRVLGTHRALAGPATPLRSLEQCLSPLPPPVLGQGLGAHADGRGRRTGESGTGASGLLPYTVPRQRAQSPGRLLTLLLHQLNSGGPPGPQP